VTADSKYALNYAALLAAIAAGIIRGTWAAFLAVSAIAAVLIAREVSERLMRWMRILEKVHEQQKKLVEDSVAYTKILADFRQRLSWVEEQSGLIRGRLGMTDDSGG